MPAVGRPSKFTDKARKKIYKAIQVGLSYREAALAAGIGESTLRLWRKRAKTCADDDVISKYYVKDDEERLAYIEFYRQITSAQAVGEAALAARIAKAGRGGHKYKEERVKERDVLVDGEIVTLTERVTIVKRIPPNWRADAWVLERRHPDRWTKPRDIDFDEVRKREEKPYKEKELNWDALTVEELGILEGFWIRMGADDDPYPT